MKRNFLKKMIRPVILVAILGLVLTVLAGCGIGHGPHRYGYNGYHGAVSGDGYRNSGSYGPDDRGYQRRMPGYGYGGDGYCGW